MTENVRYMLDTNTVSYIIKGNNPSIRERLLEVPMANICISAITEAELWRGVAKKPEAIRLKTIVHEFLLRVEVLPWDSVAAKTYAELRTASEKEGISLGCMDMLIAAHSKSEDTVLVTNDKAFFNIQNLLKLEDWSQA
ncbi:MAG: type II toxin-antitoxin system VapC family toxin [Pseudomonadota bacterium]|nr:type II toxin-antitoxin system VapC family toxin [Pseudomonadota bacterium]|tara:strand:- start:492 stop:908 length:417 start_codon:yes stop_codon:yes gene_type:complete